jgi:hypothetical protein
MIVGLANGFIRAGDVFSRPNVPFVTGRLAGEVWFRKVNSNFKGGAKNGGRS